MVSNRTSKFLRFFSVHNAPLVVGSFVFARCTQLLAYALIKNQDNGELPCSAVMLMSTVMVISGIVSAISAGVVDRRLLKSYSF